MIESLRAIASSATAFVRSTVRSTEFICLRSGSKGDSRSTEVGESSVRRESICIRTSCVVKALIGQRFRISIHQYSFWSTHSLTYNRRIALTTALEKGAVDTGAAILYARLAVAANMQSEEAKTKCSTGRESSKTRPRKARNQEF